MMNHRFETIIFDLDGTLADTAPDVMVAINHALNKMKARPVSLDQVKRAIGPGKEEFIQTVLPDARKSEKEKFLASFRAFYWDHCLSQTALYPQMEEVLNKLQGRALAVASNKPRFFTEKILKGLGVLDLFHGVVGPEDVTHAKPHPEMIVALLKRLEKKPSRTLLVGDTDKDMLAGRGAGVRLCAVRYGYGRSEDLIPQRPDFLIDYPGELLDIIDNNFTSFSA